MKKSDLHIEWARRVLDMCEGTGVDPLDCWKYAGMSVKEFHSLNGMDLHKYECAVAILEKKPVFAGDVIYHKISSMTYKVRWCDGLINDNEWTWNQPNKTFMLNGEELPCPVKEDGDLYILKIEAGYNYKKHISFRFNRIEDRDKVADAIIKLLKESTGNGE